MSKKKIKLSALALLFLFCAQIFSPTVAFALTGGPASPEFSSFEPVATTDMVNPFTGDFTYNLPIVNIPGPEGAGYSLSLSYHSGVSSDEEASWVGFGWTLNPGAINRNMRGFPDDYKEANVKQYNKVRPNWTSSIVEDLNIEAKSQDQPKVDTSVVKSIGKLKISHSLRYNNYRGFSASTGFGLDFKGMGSANLNFSGSDVTANLSVNPIAILNRKKDAEKEKDAKNRAKIEKNKKEYKGIKSVNKPSQSMLKDGLSKVKGSARSMASISAYGINSFLDYGDNVSVARYKGISYDWTSNLKLDALLPNVGFELGFSGNYNLQANVPVFNSKASGFMYNPNITSYTNEDGSSNVLSDFYTEKGTPYDNKAFNLGIPVNNADVFCLTGEGLSGGFQIFHKEPGHFYPTFVKNEQKIKKMAFELTTGRSGKSLVDIGVGFDFAVPNTGLHNVRIMDWVDVNPDNCGTYTSYGYQFDQTESDIFMRFNGDMGGQIAYSNNTNTVAAAPVLFCESSGAPGAKNFIPSITSVGIHDIEEYKSSSYINYNLYSASNLFDKSTSSDGINDMFTPTSEMSKQIKEVSITNESGLNYVYGIPVLSRNNRNFQIGREDFSATSLQNNYLYYPSDATTKTKVYVDADTDPESPIDEAIVKNKIIVGEEKVTPYATSFLLTQITSPYYVDIDGNGPSDSDFGGWTKFSYRKRSPGTDEWYNFRSPFTGLTYQEGSLSDKNDDMGSFSSGQKQVRYLKTIETKTHIAYFITNKTEASEFAGTPTEIATYLTGSGDNRFDGLGVADIETDGSDPSAHKNAEKDPNQSLEYLEKVVLFSKSRMTVPLQTTYFKYDYSLVRNLPNSIHGKYPDSPQSNYNNSGKLTLKKVWVEHEGTSQNKIAPYIFNYTYRADYTNNLSDKYENLENDVKLFSESEQNPDYKPEALDAWGNYQYNGAQRFANMKSWVSQEDRSSTAASFDPGAWQLKQIILPSGGEINIQFEEGDYAYVQDRDAMAMVSLTNDSFDSKKAEETEYVINTDDLGLSNTGDIELYAARLKKYFDVLEVDPEDRKSFEERRRIYFKFLYDLKGNHAALDNCSSEYITGYSVVNDIIYDDMAHTITFKIGRDGSVGSKRKTTPKWAAYDFYVSSKIGMLDNSDCTSELDGFDKDVLTYYDNGIKRVYSEGIPEDEGDFAEFMLNNKKNSDGPDVDETENRFKKKIVKPLYKKLIGAQFDHGTPDIDKVCRNVNYALSYLKLPIPLNKTEGIACKKGGGVRVKRILMYDSGLTVDNGRPNVYGSEYRYVSADGKRSSGVAANEPGGEENSLKSFLPRLKKNVIERVISGRDKEQVEGPIGESLLPSPSVGYSRIEIRNIHQDPVTGTGYQVNEYFTAKDFPFDKNYESVDNMDFTGQGVEFTDIKDNREKDKVKATFGLFNYIVDKKWLTQGYRFIINGMHGQIKRTQTYGQNNQLTAQTEYDYYKPGEKVDMLSFDPDADRYTLEKGMPGKEEQVTMAMSRLKDLTVDLNLELDLLVQILPAVAVDVKFNAFPSFTYVEKDLSTHVTTKILNYPVIQKSITNFRDGVTHKTENIAFNPHTGKPVLTKSSDGFDNQRLDKQNDLATTEVTTFHSGAIYNLDIPASWVYSELGQKAGANTNTNQLNLSAGSITYYGELPYTKVTDGDPENDHLYTVNPAGVVASSAKTYKNTWFPTDVDQNLKDYSTSIAAKRTELNNTWHEQKNYVYKTTVKDANQSNIKIYNGGVFNSFTMFDWNPLTTYSTSSPWLMANEVTLYSPDGSALEEKNILDIHSANKFGYSNTLVTMSAQNAKYNNIAFEDFENLSSVVSGVAHTGKKSINYNQTSSFQFLSTTKNVLVDDQLKSHGALVKVWVKSFYPANTKLLNSNPSFKASLLGGLVIKQFNKIAQTGEWSLYEAKFEGADFVTQTNNTIVTMTLQYNIDNGELVYMDDFRFQPYDSNASCYVYDVASKRLLAQFDDQHFALLYQYNDEGKLVRKMVETEKGLKTIQETQYNTPKQVRQ